MHSVTGLTGFSVVVYHFPKCTIQGLLMKQSWVLDVWGESGQVGAFQKDPGRVMLLYACVD